MQGSEGDVLNNSREGQSVQRPADTRGEGDTNPLVVHPPDDRPIVIPDLGEAVDLYIQNRSIKETTERVYRQQLGIFVDWWKANERRFGRQLSRGVMEVFADWLEHGYCTKAGDPLAESTRHTIAKRVRGFLRWYPAGTDDWMPVPPEPESSTRALHLDELAALLQAAREGRKASRDLALLAFLTDTATRPYEAAHACIENLHFEPNDSGWCRLTVVKSRLNESRERVVVFGARAGKILRTHLFLHPTGRGPIFGVSDSGMQTLITRLAERAEVDVTAMMFRRLFATYWVSHCPASKLESEILLDIQLGHKPPSVMRRHYARFSHLDVHRSFVSPLDTVSLSPPHAGQ